MSNADDAFTRTDLYGSSIGPTYSGALSFARRKYTHDLTGVDVAIAGYPFDLATTNRPGARFGPRGIRAASTQLCWDRLWPNDFDVFDYLAVTDYGDCLFDHGDPESIAAVIEAHCDEIIAAGCALLALGGDHFISLPLLRAHFKRYGPMALVHFDAHTDTWSDKGMRLDHGTMFYHAVKEGLIIPDKSVQIGIRTYNHDPLGIHILDATVVEETPSREIGAQVKTIVGDTPTYLTFDIDCLDPSYAPGTGTPVCGGLSSGKALAILRSLSGIAIKGMDLAEVAPSYDVAEITSLAGATIAMQMLSLYAVSRLSDLNNS